MTTWAVLQKSAPRDSASGASGLVSSLPCSRMALTWLRKCRTTVDFCFIPARFLGADDAAEVFASFGEQPLIHLSIDPTEPSKANLPGLFVVVDPLDDLVGEVFGSGKE